MPNSKAKILIRIILWIGIATGLIAGFFLPDGQMKTTLRGIGVGITLGAFVLLVLTYIKPSWFADKTAGDQNKF